MLRRAVLRLSNRRLFDFASSTRFPKESLRQCSSSSQIPNSHFVEHLEDTPQSPPSATISIDRSNLYHPPGTPPTFTVNFVWLIHALYFSRFFFRWDCDWILSEAWFCAEHSHEPSTESELVKHLKSIIKVHQMICFFFPLVLFYSFVRLYGVKFSSEGALLQLLSTWRKF